MSRLLKPLMSRTLILALLISLVPACGGYSEEEWQQQLDKYKQLYDDYGKEKAAHQATRAELEAELAKQKKLIGDLRTQLKAMGVNLDSLSAKLQEEGTEKERLASNLEQLKQALEEYKKRADQLKTIKERFELLRDKLNKLTDMGLKVSIRNNRMVISLPGDVLFAPGRARLAKGGIEVLGKVADVIRADETLKSRYFQVAGHTDNKPLRGGQYIDNWGLSAMRARSVLLWLVDDPKSRGGGGGLDTKYLHAAGYADTDPIADNGTKEGRTQNRLVELVLMPDVSEILDLKSLI